VRRGLDALDRWASTKTAAENLVITHGEPHPGNVIRIAGGIVLIDWDTVALAPPERDLWMVATETGDELRRYTELTGRHVEMAAIERYRLRWALDDLSCFVRDLRAPHRRTPGTEHAWQALQITIDEITAHPSPGSSHPAPAHPTPATCSSGSPASAGTTPR
jgi:spectinomycin phosphotransferase